LEDVAMATPRFSNGVASSAGSDMYEVSLEFFKSVWNNDTTVPVFGQVFGHWYIVLRDSNNILSTEISGSSAGGNGTIIPGSTASPFAYNHGHLITDSDGFALFHITSPGTSSCIFRVVLPSGQVVNGPTIVFT
jgi:hypothetical protein